MLRVQLAAAFAILILAVTGVSFFAHKSASDKVLERDAEAALNRAATSAEHERRLAEYSLRLKAQHVGSGADVYEALKANYAGTEENPVAPDQQTHKRHLAVHEMLSRYKIEFELYLKGKGKGVDALDMPLMFSKPAKPDLFFIVDEKGIGQAALGKDLYKWYGADVSKSYPLISEVMVKNEVRTGFWHFSFDPKTKNKPLFQVALAPIRKARDGKPVGVVVIGNLLNDGVAKRTQAIVTAREKSEKSNPLDPQIAFFHDGKIVASTLDSSAQDAVTAELIGTQKILDNRKKATKFELNDTVYMARANYLLGQNDEKKPAGMILISDMTAFKKPMRAPGTTTVFAGLAALVVGILLVMIFVALFLSPLAKLEQGIQEIIAGNKDYEFEEAGNKVSRGLAQQLNLMSAFLQGKKMPDDDDAGGGSNWGELGGGGAQKRPAGQPQVGGVSMADLMKKRPDDENQG